MRKLVYILSSGLFLQGSRLVAEIASLRFLSVHEIGVIQLLLVLQLVLGLSRAGIINGLNREYPFALAQKKTRKAEFLSSAAAKWCLCTGLFGFFLHLVLSIGQTESAWFWGFAAFGIVSLLEPIPSLMQVRLRGQLSFEPIARIEALTAILGAILFIAVPVFGFFGYLVRLVLLSILDAYLYWNTKNKFSVVYDVHRLELLRLRFLFNVGWKIWFANYLRNLTKAFPSIALYWWGGENQVAQFAPVQKLSQAMTIFTGNIATVVTPKITMLVASSKSSGDTAVGFACKVSLLAFLLSSPLVVIWICICPMFVKSILPQYESAIVAIQIGSISAWLELYTFILSARILQLQWRRTAIYISVIVLLRGLSAFSVGLFFENLPLGVTIGLLFCNFVVSIIALADAYVEYFIQRQNATETLGSSCVV